MTRPDFLQRGAAGPKMQQMWTPYKVCDACRAVRATVETETGFFLCEECEAVAVIAFHQFELPSAAVIAD